ncbi:LINE-1 retrotransposable element ORF2 protein, partial [Varanus komodoensis]
MDYKIFASIMAERLKKYLTDFIHSDQNGFLPKRQMRNKLRTVLDILEYCEIHTEKPMALLFMDTQKAFDNVNWQFLKQQPAQMEFGEKFINTISSIFQKQSARIIINGEFTNIIDTQKGTRQGCPLSPLLFILILEVLNRNIRDDMDIKGTRIRDESYKLQAFADDLVFITEEPLVTMPKLCKGLKNMAREKTKLLVKNLTQEQRKTLVEQVGFWIVKKVKYLGIYLTTKCTTLKEDNYDKLFKEIKSDLEKWANLQVSLLGRIALAKMNILPKLLFLFQVIPIKIDRNFFDDLNFQISRFMWRKKKPRIKLKILQEAKENGGFGLPDWMLYYQASVLMWLKEWITLRNKRILYLEGHDLQMGWHAYM